jgi:16S rRNA (guanine1516-N2)-methyltransferase
VNLSIVCLASERLLEAQQLAEQMQLPLAFELLPGYEFALVFAEDGVSLRSVQQSDKKGQKDIMVDFCGGAAAHRRKYGGGKGQLIAKAVGLKAGFKPPVYDMTAGLGGDAFVLASLGCQVTMVERNPVVHALLADGLARAKAFAEDQDAELLETIQRMQLVQANAVEWLRQTDEKLLSVIYLDPMFPERKKSASVKKEMRAFHSLVGDDADAGELLSAALAAVEHRVVVKRPRLAPSIDDREPSLKLEGKSSRYDIYARKSLAK